jgi:hypothetical protein
LVVLPHGWQPALSLMVDVDKAALHEVLTSGGCRRLVMSHYLDARPDDARCGEGEEKCDWCEAGVGEELGRHGDERVTKRVGEGQDQILGPVMLLRARMHDQMVWDRYVQGLEGLRGQCIMCRLAGRDWGYTLIGCKDSDKWVYINGKKEVMAQGRGRWISAFSACFRCYQPQELCEPGGRGCEYPDLVMPGMVALWLSVGYRKWLEEQW